MRLTVDQLLQAAGCGDLTQVRTLIDQGVGLSDSNDIGYTPIMSAARSYRVEIVSLLIGLGADVNAVTEDGQSVLHAAVGETPSQPDRQAECVRLLLDAGADGDVTTPYGYTPLMLAAWFGCADAAKVLVAAGVNQSIQDQQGRNAKDIAKDRGHCVIAELLG